MADLDFAPEVAQQTVPIVVVEDAPIIPDDKFAALKEYFAQQTGRPLTIQKEDLPALFNLFKEMMAQPMPPVIK